MAVLLDYDQQRQQFIVQTQEKRLYMHRLNILIEEAETRAAIEERRVEAMLLGKSVMLRLNTERIIFLEVLKQKPEVRQPNYLTNAIERFLDLDRI